MHSIARCVPRLVPTAPRRRVPFLAALVLAGSAAAWTAAGAAGMTDQTFVKNAAQGGMAEVQMGQLAADKASDGDVKSFAQRMVEDHSQANDKLKSIAKQANLKVPTGLNATDKAHLKELRAMKAGPAFDYRYMGGQEQAHQKTVALFEREANSGRKDAVAQFAQQTLPTLREHLDMAKRISAQLAQQNPQLVQGSMSSKGTRSGSSGGMSGATGSGSSHMAPNGTQKNGTQQ